VFAPQYDDAEPLGNAVERNIDARTQHRELARRSVLLDTLRRLPTQDAVLVPPEHWEEA
jgi:hypothetical protein